MQTAGMRRTTSSRKVWIVLSAAAGLGITAFVLGGRGWPSISMDHLYHRLVKPLLRLLLFLGIGLLLAETMESLGWTSRLAVWMRPVMRWGRMKEDSGAAFTAALFSGILANNMLMTSYREGKLTQRELTISYLMNTGLPVFLLHLPTTFFIITPLTREAGLVYLGLSLAAATLRTCALVIYSRLRSPKVPPEPPSTGRKQREGGLQEVFPRIWKRFRNRFLRLIGYTLPIYVLVFLLNEGGVFQWLRTATSHWVSSRFAPVESISVVLFSLAAEFSAGIAAAGALLDSGALTVQQTVLALVLGSIVATPVRALRHQFPRLAGIFSPRLGLRLLVYSQTLRIASLLLVTIPYLTLG